MVYHDDPFIPGEPGRPPVEPSPADLDLDKDKVDDVDRSHRLDDEAGDDPDEDDL